VDALVKERLTGAIILVLLIVLLVPEFLKGPIRSAPRAAAAAAEDAPLRSYTINLTDEAHARTASPSTASGPQPPAPLPAAPAAASSDGQADEPPAATAGAMSPAPKPLPAAHPAASSPPSAETGSGWTVQLGSFASRPNAERLARQVKGQGFPVSVSQYPSGRHLYRVRVGPVADHAAANQLQEKLHAAGHSGAIVAPQ
jgi:cell division septation protein DedD